MSPAPGLGPYNIYRSCLRIQCVLIRQRPVRKTSLKPHPGALGQNMPTAVSPDSVALNSAEMACSLLSRTRSSKRTRRYLELPVDDWVQVATPSLGTLSRICEVNFMTAQVALGFLCNNSRATYVGIDFHNSSPRERRTLEQHLPARARVVAGDDMRTVRIAPGVDDCDVLILGSDGGAQSRKRLLSDLPNALRRAGPRGVVIMHGRECKAGRKIAPMLANIRPTCSRASCTMHGWCQRWQEFVEAGVISDARCQRSAAGRRWCTGRLDAQSICTRRTPLLQGTTGSVVRFGKLGQLPGPWRYFTVRPCSPTAIDARGNVCLFFKDGVIEAFVGGLTSTDGLSFPPLSDVGLVLPRRWRHASMTHNLAIAIDNGDFLLVGGLFNPQSEAGVHANDGVWIARASSWQFRENDTELGANHALHAGGQNGHWRDVRLLLTGKHPGCTERRDPAVAPLAYPHVCEFDGRFSLVRFRERYLLYGRANPGLHGERYVQVTGSTDLRNWSAFELIDVRGYHHSQGDMYFFSVQVNPLDPHTLVALVPLVHRLRGCLGLTASRDGLHWSEITPLIRCDVYGERTAHHPVDGILVSGEHIDIYIHQNVPGITADTVTARGIRRFPYLRQPPPRLMRYRVPKATWSGWIDVALTGLL